MLKSWQQLYRHRTLAEILVGRELKARYRGTLLGFLWSFANPLLTMSIYVLVFRVYMRIDVENYPAFVLCGLLPWLSFAAGITDGMSALINNGGIIKKVYLPTEVFPFVAVSSNLVHFLLSVPVLLALLMASHLTLSAHLLLLPLLLLLQFTFTYACALVLASLAVQFRDLLHVVPNLMLIWFYLTPVFYRSSMVPAAYRPLIYLNPMSFLIESYRDIFFAHQLPSATGLLSFAAGALLLLLLGMGFFARRRELYPEMV